MAGIVNGRMGIVPRCAASSGVCLVAIECDCVLEAQTSTAPCSIILFSVVFPAQM